MKEKEGFYQIKVLNFEIGKKYLRSITWISYYIYSVHFWYESEKFLNWF